MLYPDLLETEDKSVKKAIMALQCLKKLRFHELAEDIVLAAHNVSHALEFYHSEDGVDYEITVSAIGTSAITVKIADVNAASSDRVHVSMNAERLLTVKTNHVENYTSIEWLLVVCKDVIITNNHEHFEKANLLEHRFQYDTVNPLAGLLLDFWGE